MHRRTELQIEAHIRASTDSGLGIDPGGLVPGMDPKQNGRDRRLNDGRETGH